MESKLHQKFQYQWPKTVGFFTAKQHEKIIADFECNDNYYVTEKLDGSNLAISSKGYIASRTKVIATRSEPVPKFNQHSLHNVVELFSAVDQLYNYLQTMYFIQHDFELLVFGEFLYNGTASCKFMRHFQLGPRVQMPSSARDPGETPIKGFKAHLRDGTRDGGI